MPSAKRNSTMKRAMDLISSLFTNHSHMHYTRIMDLSLSCNSFRLQCKFLICDSVVCLTTGFIMFFSLIFHSDLDSLQEVSYTVIRLKCCVMSGA